MSRVHFNRVYTEDEHTDQLLTTKTPQMAKPSPSVKSNTLSVFNTVTVALNLQ